MKNETVQTATQVKINDSERQKNANRYIYTTFPLSFHYKTCNQDGLLV